MVKYKRFYLFFIIYYLGFISQTSAAGFMDYTQQHLVCCNKDQCDLNYSNDHISKIIILHEIDKYFLIVAGPVAICCTLFIIITFIMYPKIREQPGDIILGISISDFVLSWHWTISAAYMIDNQNSPECQSNFCQYNALFSTAAGTLEFLYNMCFCIYLFIMIKSSQQLRIKNIPKYSYHLVCVVISASVVIYFKLKDQLGLNLFGTCSIANFSDLGWQGLIILFFYLIISWGCVGFFKKYVPKDNTKISLQGNLFIQYYYYYVIASSIIFTTLAICNLLASLNCGFIQNASLNIVLTIGNIAKVMTPITLSIIRYKDPILKSKIKNLLQKWGIVKKYVHHLSSQQTINKSQSNTLNENLVGKDLSVSQQEIQLQNKQQNSSIKQEQSLQQEDQVQSRATSYSYGSNWLESLTSQLRIAQIYTLLAGIIQNHKQHATAFTHLQPQQSINSSEPESNSYNENCQFTAKDFQEVEEIQVNQETLDQDQVEQITDKQQVQPLASILQIYAPKVFQMWREEDQLMIDLDKSLNLLANFPNIKKKFGEVNQGGKSGEFFYSSFDNRIVIKTMRQEELDSFLEKFDQFFLHYQDHKDSLVIKIYGIYTINRINACESTKLHAFIMRNVASCNSSQIIRIFDLKGSLYDREVLNKHKQVTDLSKIVLKDIDFQKLEGRIKIEKSLAKKCSQVLEYDSLFLEGCGFIDYSLVVFKINWNQQINENPDDQNLQQLKNQLFKNDLFMISSSEEKGIYYQISIIDYLQKWNYQKLLEKHSKKLINLNKKIDPSAQDPKAYGNRFREKIAKGLFIKNHINNKDTNEDIINIPLN